MPLPFFFSHACEQCVAHLVALQGDHHRALADMAQRALVSVIDKDSKLVLSRLVDGIALSYKFQKEVFQECKGIHFILCWYLSSKALAITPGKGATLRESIFSRLYALFKGSKTTRQGFLHTLLRQYEIDPVCTSSFFLSFPFPSPSPSFLPVDYFSLNSFRLIANFCNTLQESSCLYPSVTKKKYFTLYIISIALLPSLGLHYSPISKISTPPPLMAPCQRRQIQYLV